MAAVDNLLHLDDQAYCGLRPPRTIGIQQRKTITNGKEGRLQLNAFFFKQFGDARQCGAALLANTFKRPRGIASSSCRCNAGTRTVRSPLVLGHGIGNRRHQHTEIVI